MRDFQTAALMAEGKADAYFPPGVVSPYFACQLALRLGMPVSELHTRMSNHELTVIWPAFFKAEARIAAHKAKEAAENT